MDPGTAGFLLFQSRSSGNGRVDGHVVVSVHLLEIGPESHEQQAYQRHMIFLAEIHQTLRRLLFQMEDIQRGIHGIRYVNGRSGIGIAASLPLFLQRPGTVNPIINRFRHAVDKILEIRLVPFLRFASRLIGQILLQLLDIGRHILRIVYSLIHGIAVQFDHVPQETDQRLGVHNPVIHQQIHALETVRHLDHDNPAHGRILGLERHCRPLRHDFLRLFHGAGGKIHKLHIRTAFLCVHHILVPGSLLVRRETDTQALAPLVCLADGGFQHLPIKLRLDGQAGTHIEHFLFRTEILVKKVELLCSSQRIYRISFSFLHHFFIKPPINSSSACS